MKEGRIFLLTFCSHNSFPLKVFYVFFKYGLSHLSKEVVELDILRPFLALNSAVEHSRWNHNVHWSMQILRKRSLSRREKRRVRGGQDQLLQIISYSQDSLDLRPGTWFRSQRGLPNLGGGKRDWETIFPVERVEVPELYLGSCDHYWMILNDLRLKNCIMSLLSI